MNKFQIVALIIFIGFFLIIGLVIYETDQKMQEYLKEHPELQKNQTQQSPILYENQ